MGVVAPSMCPSSPLRTVFSRSSQPTDTLTWVAKISTTDLSSSAWLNSRRRPTLTSRETVAVGAVHGWWSLWLGGNDLNIVYREDTFFAGAKVAAEPPVVVHVLVHGNLVTSLKGTVIWLCISIQCCSTSDLRLCRRSRRRTVWEGGSSRCAVCWWRRVIETHVVESVGWYWSWNRSLGLYGCRIAASRST